MHDGHDHAHPHAREQERGHGHDDAHGGDISRNKALLAYMLEHNRSHALELAEAGTKLIEAGYSREADLILDAVRFFDQGNDKLEQTLELLGNKT
jgi:hypothetical protein